MTEQRLPPPDAALHVRRHTELLAAQAEWQGARVLEVGCGDGRLTAWLASLGAVAIGIEQDEAASRRAFERLGRRRIVRAAAQHLPVASGALDAVIFMNSFHHLPAEAMHAALAEAGRTLREDGVVLVIEPLAQGDYFELLRPIEDETAVRDAARRAIERATDAGVRRTGHELYATRVRQPDAQALLSSFEQADPSRAAAIASHREEVARRFERLGEVDEERGGRVFIQPFEFHRLEPSAR